MPSRTPSDCLSCEDRPRRALAPRDQPAFASCAPALPPETRSPLPAPPGGRPSILAPLVLLGEQELFAGARARQAESAALSRLPRAAAVLVCLEHQPWDLDRLAVLVLGHEREPGGADVLPFSGERILALDADARLHRGAERRVHLRAQLDDHAHPDGAEEMQIVHRCRHHALAAVAL